MSRNELEKIANKSEDIARIYNLGFSHKLDQLTGIRYAMQAVEGEMVVELENRKIKSLKLYYGSNEISIDIPTNL